MRITMKNGVTVINGTTYRGTNIQLTGKRVIVDGIDQNTDLGPAIDVQVHGDVESLDLETGTLTSSPTKRLSRLFGGGGVGS